MATVAQTSLSELERRTLERAVELLRERFGDELISVWLYGSRARGETPRDEDSDVDVMVVVEEEAKETSTVVKDLVREAATEVGGELFQWGFHTIVVDPASLARRRSIGAFFIAGVDQDKLVLFGDREGGAESVAGLLPDAVARRTDEYIARAHRFLNVARIALENGEPIGVPHGAYYASLSAVRAALSSEDEYVRTHPGAWGRFHDLFVDTGRVPQMLHAAAHALEERRLSVDYEGEDFTFEQAEDAVETATAFLAAVEQALSGS